MTIRIEYAGEARPIMAVHFGVNQAGCFRRDHGDIWRFELWPYTSRGEPPRISLAFLHELHAAIEAILGEE